MERETAMKILKELHDNSLFSNRIALEVLIPELADSNDERIRKALVRFHKSTIDIDGIKGADILAWLEKQGNEPAWCHHKADLSDCTEEYRKAYYDGWNNCNQQHSQCDADKNDVIKCLINGMRFYYEDNKDATWGTDKWSMPVKHIIDVLEKQGNQKPTEPKPKFKVGDWVVYECGEDSATLQIKNIVYGTYEFTDDSTLNVIDEDSLRLWSIKDAKDGDVLVDVYGDIGIFQKNDDFDWSSYCSLGSNGEFRCFAIEHESDRSHPATKEQRDTLMKAMADAGYTFDFEKKELKKFEDEIEIPFGAKDSELQEETYYIPKGFHAEINNDKVVIKKGEKSAAWSEEDELIVLSIKQVIQCASSLNLVPEKLDKIDKWLKSLKDRIGE